MSFFKKPVVAAVVCVLLVAASTLASVKLKLGEKCNDVTDLFYTGVTVSNQLHPALAEQLISYCAVSKEISLIASSYGIDTEELDACCDWLDSAMKYSPREISYIYYEFSGFSAALKKVVYALDACQLSDRHAALMTEYEQSMKSFDENIADSGYNDYVRSFRLKYERFPAAYLAGLVGVTMPGYFA